MKILITGCNGYIGLHLCKLLKTQELHGLDIHETSKSEYISKYFPVDIKEQYFLPDEYDVVIHLAALVRVGESVKEPTKYYHTNVIGTNNTLLGTTFKQFIFASTGAAATPTSPYAISKVVAEQYVDEYCKVNNIPFTMFRFYNVTGTDGYPATNPDGLFYKLVEAIDTNEFNIYGHDYDTEDGTAIRDYVHVNEICASIIKSIDHQSNQVENLGHGRGYSVKTIVETFKKVNDVDFKVNLADRREGDPERTILDNVSPFMIELYTLEDYLKIN